MVTRNNNTTLAITGTVVMQSESKWFAGNTSKENHLPEPLTGGASP